MLHRRTTAIDPPAVAGAAFLDGIGLHLPMDPELDLARAASAMEAMIRSVGPTSLTEGRLLGAAD
jgi:hypothetical protein